MIESDDLKNLDEKDKSDPIFEFEPQKTPPTLTYAWNWFSYHAQQRLTAFHYFLIIVGFLIAGYITSLENDLYVVQAILGLVGVLISIAFLALDVRNTQLVDDGRDALRKIEKALNMETGIHRADYGRAKKALLRELLLDDWLKTSSQRKIRISHGFWLRSIERVALLLFFAAFLVGVWNCSWYIARTEQWKGPLLILQMFKFWN